ncbi:MAG TPA: ABC transporter permease, partial [Flavobacterium sp.]|nr:ABC transporter permease [Flavobacterium sp.]
MFNIERWQEIFEAIGKNKLRTFLTGISVASGIFILVILLGVGKGLQNGIEKQFERDAAGLIEVFTGVTSKEYKGLNPGRHITLHNSDYDLSLQKYGNVLDKKSVSHNNWNTVIIFGKETGTYQYRGVLPDHQAIENMTIIEGRFVNFNDINRVEKVAVIGNKIKLDLFKEKSPIGEQVTVNGIPFKIIGVFTDPAGEREESRAYIPIATTQKVFGGGDTINTMFYTMKKYANYDIALAESEKFKAGLDLALKAKKTVAPDDESAIEIHNSIEDAKQFYDLNLYISMFFWWVGICTIIAGVVGVSNIMLI